MKKKQQRIISNFNKQAIMCMERVSYELSQDRTEAGCELIRELCDATPASLVKWGMRFWRLVAEGTLDSEVERTDEGNNDAFFTDFMTLFPVLSEHIENTGEDAMRLISWQAALPLLIKSYHHAFCIHCCGEELGVRVGSTVSEPNVVQFVVTFWGQIQWTKYGKWLLKNRDQYLLNRVPTIVEPEFSHC